MIRLLAVFATVLCSSFALDYDAGGGLSLTLLHALDNTQAEFTFRGNLTVSTQGWSTVHQEPLTAEYRQSLKALAEKDSFYRLKAIVTYNDGSTSSFLTFSRAVSPR